MATQDVPALETVRPVGLRPTGLGSNLRESFAGRRLVQMLRTGSGEQRLRLASHISQQAMLQNYRIHTFPATDAAPLLDPERGLKLRYHEARAPMAAVHHCFIFVYACRHDSPPCAWPYAVAERADKPDQEKVQTLAACLNPPPSEHVSLI